MNVTLVVLVVVVLVVAAAIAIWYLTQQQRRRTELRQQFGPEYDHAVETYGGRADDVLEDRTERVAALHIRPLSREESQSFGANWRQVQTDFVDDPEGAIRRADALCTEVMQTRGYPMGNFDQRAADVSVDHPSVVEHYRAAHTLAQKAARGDASTEELRQAMVHYRSLFEDLIDTREPARVERS